MLYDGFAIFIDACWAKLCTESEKGEDIALFIAVGIDLQGNLDHSRGTNRALTSGINHV